MRDADQIALQIALQIAQGKASLCLSEELEAIEPGLSQQRPLTMAVAAALRSRGWVKQRLMRSGVRRFEWFRDGLTPRACARPAPPKKAPARNPALTALQISQDKASLCLAAELEAIEPGLSQQRPFVMAVAAELRSRGWVKERVMRGGVRRVEWFRDGLTPSAVGYARDVEIGRARVRELGLDLI